MAGFYPPTGITVQKCKGKKAKSIRPKRKIGAGSWFLFSLEKPEPSPKGDETAQRAKKQRNSSKVSRSQQLDRCSCFRSRWRNPGRRAAASSPPRLDEDTNYSGEVSSRTGAAASDHAGSTQAVGRRRRHPGWTRIRSASAKSAAGPVQQLPITLAEPRP